MSRTVVAVKAGQVAGAGSSIRTSSPPPPSFGVDSRSLPFALSTICRHDGQARAVPGTFWCSRPAPDRPVGHAISSDFKPGPWSPHRHPTPPPVGPAHLDHDERAVAGELPARCPQRSRIVSSPPADQRVPALLAGQHQGHVRAVPDWQLATDCVPPGRFVDSHRWPGPRFGFGQDQEVFQDVGVDPRRRWRRSGGVLASGLGALEAAKAAGVTQSAVRSRATRPRRTARAASVR